MQLGELSKESFEGNCKEVNQLLRRQRGGSKGGSVYPQKARRELLRKISSIAWAKTELILNYEQQFN